ncbi:MAG: acyl-CoA desaturase [Bacteroidetes bacterium]|jgi:linoleoyl-CoA desaturase|nr:acyl-CoA desaturase [Bacteroidota bacterium]
MTRDPIYFDRKTGKEFIQELRTQVNTYFSENGISTYANPSMVIKTFYMLALYFVPYALMVFGVVSSFWGIGAMFVLMGFGMAGLGLSVMHDANHESYSRHKSVNWLLGGIINFIGGHAPNWQVQHNFLHHGYTNIEGMDDDISTTSILRFSPNQELKKVHKAQHLYAWFFYSIMTLYWAIGKDFIQLHRYYKEGLPLHPTKSYPRMFLELVGVKVLYFSFALVIPLLVLPIAWYWVVAFLVVSHLISGLSLSLIFQTAHVMPTSEFPEVDETRKVDTHWAVHQMLTTANFSPRSKWFSWLIGGLNYQIEHHLFPNICHVHYPKISEIVRETAEKYGVPYHIQPTFAKAVAVHWRMLYKLGRA